MPQTMAASRRKRKTRVKSFWRDVLHNGRTNDILDYVCAIAIIHLCCPSGHHPRLKKTRLQNSAGTDKSEDLLLASFWEYLFNLLELAPPILIPIMVWYIRHPYSQLENLLIWCLATKSLGERSITMWNMSISTYFLTTYASGFSLLILYLHEAGVRIIIFSLY